MNIRKIAAKANAGETLTEEELTEMYNQLPDILADKERFQAALALIARDHMENLSDVVHFAARIVGVNHGE